MWECIISREDFRTSTWGDGQSYVFIFIPMCRRELLLVSDKQKKIFHSSLLSQGALAVPLLLS